MSKRRKKGYKLHFNSNINTKISNTISQNWTNTYGKKRIISAYLNNKEKGNIFGEENELFDFMQSALTNRRLFSQAVAYAWHILAYALAFAQNYLQFL